MDGRDIGTHVLPDAQCKIFLTASVAERARRRYTELTAKGEACVLDEICADIEKRDKNDSERRESPLRRADDAVVLDTTELTIDEAVAEAKRIISETALS